MLMVLNLMVGMVRTMISELSRVPKLIKGNRFPSIDIKIQHAFQASQDMSWQLGIGIHPLEIIFGNDIYLLLGIDKTVKIEDIYPQLGTVEGCEKFIENSLSSISRGIYVHGLHPNGIILDESELCLSEVVKL